MFVGAPDPRSPGPSSAPTPPPRNPLPLGRTPPPREPLGRTPSDLPPLDSAGPSCAGTPLGRTPLRRTAQNFALFFPSPATIVTLFCLSLGVFSWNFGGVFEGRDPQMCTFGLSGCRVKPQRLWGCRLARLEAVSRSRPVGKMTHRLCPRGAAQRCQISGTFQYLEARRKSGNYEVVSKDITKCDWQRGVAAHPPGPSHALPGGLD